MLDWSMHCGEYYECSRYKADPNKYKDKAGQERFALQKYLFYYERVNETLFFLFPFNNCNLLCIIIVEESQPEFTVGRRNS